MKRSSKLILSAGTGLLAAGVMSGCAGGHVSAEAPATTHAATHEATTGTVASPSSSPSRSPSVETPATLPVFGTGENSPFSPDLRKAAAALLSVDTSRLPAPVFDQNSDTFYISQTSYALSNGDKVDAVFSMTKDSLDPNDLAQVRVLVTDSSRNVLQTLNMGTEGYDNFIAWGEGTHTDDAIFPEAKNGNAVTTPQFCEATDQGSCWTVSDEKTAAEGLMSAVAADFNSLAQGAVDTQPYAPSQPSEAATFPAPNY
jgi:hypothetical protein